MANFTSKAIKATFLELLEKKPLSDITVKDIVESCGINRNSFYYHFQDIPALLDEIVEEDAAEIIKKHPTVNSMVECLDAIIEFATQHNKVVKHIFTSANRENFERHLITLSEYFVRNYVETALSEYDIDSETKELMVEYYKCVCMGLILDLLNNGMTEEHLNRIRKIVLVRNEIAQEFAEKLLKH